ncbi:MAG: translation elongation factor Ts [Patescibacteria group bacterium]
MVSNSDVLKLRKETSVGVMECKKALEEAKGDFVKAKEVLKARGVEIAAKKSERSTNQGIVTSYIHGAGRVGVLLELVCESDFVAKNDQFKELAKEIAMQIASMDPKTVDELLEQDYIREPQKKIEDILNEAITKIGENIKIKRFVRYSLGEE